MRLGQKRFGSILILVGALVTVGVLAATKHESAPVSTTPAPPMRDLAGRFAVLSKAHSNQCGLQADSIDSIAEDGYLRGACCGPMDRQHYEQIAGLKHYSAESVVPRDPYDVPVDLAKRLISYQETIDVTPQQQAVYESAVRLSDEHGPCCCRCWRRTAFEGQAKYLITRRRFTPKQIAHVWDLEDGCGGK